MAGQPSWAKELDCSWQRSGFSCWVAGTHAEDLEPSPELVGPVSRIVRGSEIDAGLVLAVIAAESAFDERAVSPRNAMGLMQLMPETVVRFGVRDPFDAKENIQAGTSYLKLLVKKFRNLKLALAAYNAGEAPVLAYGSVPPFDETKGYVDRVLRLYDRYEHIYFDRSDSPQASFTGATEARRCALICRGHM